MNIINEFFVSFILIKLYFKFKVCRKIKFPLLWKFYFSKWKFYFSADTYFEYVGADFEADMAKMARDENTQKWWKVTDPCQISLGYAGQKWLNMEEVFHLD